MPVPVIVLIGRPNVGKSTLFNVLTGTRDALVHDRPGVTRDRQYGRGRLGDKPYVVVDTGGIEVVNAGEIDALTKEQVEQALLDADCILMMVDAKSGLTAGDHVIASQLRQHNKKVRLVVNKADRQESEAVANDFYELGMGQPSVIASAHRRGITEMMECVLEEFDVGESEPDMPGISIAIVGRPNVGKSTLINRMLGEDRVVVSDVAGTTRDSIAIPYTRHDKEYTLIDTAGVRRRTKVTDVVEKFSIVKTMQAIERAQVVVVLLSAIEGVGEQDLRLIGWVLDAGKGLIIAVNKWDAIDEIDRERIKSELDRRLTFVSFARRYFMSAIHGTGVGKLYYAVEEAHASGAKEISTADLTRVLEQAVRDHQPPLSKGRRVKPRYAHLGSHHPLRIVVHGKQVEELPNAYVRYLQATYRKAFQLEGIPVIMKMKNDNNPYKEKR